MLVGLKISHDPTSTSESGELVFARYLWASAHSVGLPQRLPQRCFVVPVEDRRGGQLFFHAVVLVRQAGLSALLGD